MWNGDESEELIEEEKVSSDSEQKAPADDSTFSGDEYTKLYAWKYQSTFWQKNSLQSTYSNCPIRKNNNKKASGITDEVSALMLLLMRK